jgi:dolichol kinase
MSFATSVFLLAEVIRHYSVPPFGNRLKEFFSIFTDERDTRGPLVVSHIFLLVGCAVPVWMSLYGGKFASNALPIEGFSGVLCLGCGDAMVCELWKKLIRG